MELARCLAEMELAVLAVVERRCNDATPPTPSEHQRERNIGGVRIFFASHPEDDEDPTFSEEGLTLEEEARTHYDKCVTGTCSR